MSPAYEAAGQEIKRRILAMIPTHPEILDFTSYERLREIPEFDVRDIGPSGAMVQAALELAWDEWLESEPGRPKKAK